MPSRVCNFHMYPGVHMFPIHTYIHTYILYCTYPTLLLQPACLPVCLSVSDTPHSFFRLPACLPASLSICLSDRYPTLHSFIHSSTLSFALASISSPISSTYPSPSFPLSPLPCDGSLSTSIDKHSRFYSRFYSRFCICICIYICI